MLDGHLDEGSSTVGMRVQLEHISPPPSGCGAREANLEGRGPSAAVPRLGPRRARPGGGRQGHPGGRRRRPLHGEDPLTIPGAAGRPSGSVAVPVRRQSIARDRHDGNPPPRPGPGHRRRAARQVGADQLQAPTPCAEWNVGQLIDHGRHPDWARAAIDGGVEPHRTPATARPADDFRRPVRRRRRGVPGRCSRPTGPSNAPSIPASARCPPRRCSASPPPTRSPAWDLATALDLDNDLDPSSWPSCCSTTPTGRSPPSFRTEDGSIFRAERRTHPAGANAAT